MVLKNLEFFDKDGYNLNLNWNEEKYIWEGNIFFPRVSVGLYENTTIYIVEYTGYDNDYTDDVYSYPTGEGNIVFQWDLANKFVDEFFMFDFDDDYEIKDTSSLIYTPYDGPLCENLVINRFDKYTTPLLDSSQNIDQDDLLEVHVAFRSDEKSAETTYKRTLVISYENTYTSYEIARITFFAETIEEDERLKVWNENLGYNLKPEDSIIFKHSDIHESLPDFEILNEKRKELMLEGYNIYPYIGGYKAIINAIKFFGYDNLNIVEYWRNINGYDSEFGKIYRTYVYSLKDKKTVSTKRKPISLNTKDFQKLNNISLVYNINHPEVDEDGKKFDDYGLPNVIEDFDKDKHDNFKLTIEEALIKLFSLRNKLNNEFMPGSTKITDIIGEGNYFSLNLIGNNPQISTINYIESKGYIDFTVFPNNQCYITENEDFARYIAEKMNIKFDETIGGLSDKTIEELSKFYVDSDSDSDLISEIDTRTLSTLIENMLKDENDHVCTYFEEYYNMTYNNTFGDANEFGLREIPEPRNVYYDNIKTDVENDSNNITPDMVACAKVILRGSFNENINGASIIEWKISHTEKNWSTTHYGEVKTYGDVFVQLPYLGKYNVEMTVWDVYNHCCKKYVEDAIIVKPYNVDIRGFYLDARPLPDELNYDLFIPQEYLDNIEKEYRYFLWGRYVDNKKIYIVTRKKNPSEMTLLDIFGKFEISDTGDSDSDLLNYAYSDLLNINDDDRENWISIVNTENGDILKYSWMYYEEEGLVYGVDEFEFCEELTDVPFDENDAYVSDWNNDVLYHVIKKNVDKMYSGALKEHLENKDDNSSMRNYKNDGSVSHQGPYYKFDVDNILYKVERGYKEYNHLNKEIVNLNPGKHYKYVRYINSVVDIKPLTWVVLGFDFSRITGRIVNNNYPKWTLIMCGDILDPDEDLRKDKIVTTHNGLYFTYLFENEGSYKIKLELLDINGNKYEMERHIVIVDKDANYNMYHTLNDEYNKYLEEKNERNLIYI